MRLYMTHKLYEYWQQLSGKINKGYEKKGDLNAAIKSQTKYCNGSNWMTKNKINSMYIYEDSTYYWMNDP